MEGNAFKDVNSAHYKAHKSMEGFWSQYRKGGAKYGKTPSNIEYSQALLKSLTDAGLSKDDAMKAVNEAAKQRIQYGLLSGENVPNIPNPINQKK